MYSWRGNAADARGVEAVFEEHTIKICAEPPPSDPIDENENDLLPIVSGFQSDTGILHDMPCPIRRTIECCLRLNCRMVEPQCLLSSSEFNLLLRPCSSPSFLLYYFSLSHMPFHPPISPLNRHRRRATCVSPSAPKTKHPSSPPHHICATQLCKAHLQNDRSRDEATRR